MPVPMMGTERSTAVKLIVEISLQLLRAIGGACWLLRGEVDAVLLLCVRCYAFKFSELFTSLLLKCDSLLHVFVIYVQFEQALLGIGIKIYWAARVLLRVLDTLVLFMARCIIEGCVIGHI